MIVQLALLVVTVSPANALIQEGVKLRRARNDVAALAKFEEAYRLSKSSRALAQIALAEQALGRWVQAEAHLEQAMRDRRHPWIRTHRSTLRRGLATIRKRLASIDLVVSVDGALVVVNGRPVGRSPIERPVRVVAGTSVVEIQADGYWPVTRRLDIRGRGVARESFSLVKKPEAQKRVSSKISPPRVAVRPSDPDVAEVTAEPSVVNLRPYGYAAGGAAIAGAGVGVAFLVVRNNHARRYNDDDRCLVGDQTRRDNCGSDRNAAERAGRVSAAGFVGAGLLAATSVALFIFDMGRSETSAARARTAGGSLVCETAVGDFGLGCTVRF